MSSPAYSDKVGFLEVLSTGEGSMVRQKAFVQRVLRSDKVEICNSFKAADV